MDEGKKTNLTNPDLWIRLLYMLVFALLLWVARLVIAVIALLQFLFVLFGGNDNANLRDLGQGLARWCLQAYLFITFNSEDKPFPFADWPIPEVPSPSPWHGNEAESELQPQPERRETPPAPADDVPSFTGVRIERGRSDDAGEKDSG